MCYRLIQETSFSFWVQALRLRQIIAERTGSHHQYAHYFLAVVYLRFHIGGDNISFLIDLRRKRTVYEKQLFGFAVYVAQNNILSVYIPMNR